MQKMDRRDVRNGDQSGGNQSNQDAANVLLSLSADGRHTYMYDYYDTLFLHQLPSCPIPPSPSPSSSFQLSHACTDITTTQSQSTQLLENQPSTSTSDPCRQKTQSELNTSTTETETSTSSAAPELGEVPSTSKGGDWNTISTRALISVYEANKDRFVGSNKKRNKVWLDITSQLIEMGFDFTDKQVKNRWHYLQNKYKKIIDDNNTSGNGRKTWDFYDEMDGLLGDKPNIKPTCILETNISDEEDDKLDDSINSVDGKDEKEPEKEDKSSRKRKYTTSVDKVDNLFKQFWEEKRKTDEEKEKKRETRELEKEEKKEKRHQEKQELLKAFIGILNKNKDN